MFNNFSILNLRLMYEKMSGCQFDGHLQIILSDHPSLMPKSHGFQYLYFYLSEDVFDL